MRHLEKTDIASFVSGECGWLETLKANIHLAQCKKCRTDVELARAELEDECRLAIMLQKYNTIDSEAETTMTPPHFECHE